jgi:hypothetical protein
MAYALESIILGTAAGWMAWLYWHRRAGVIAAFGALYLVFPAVALGLQAATGPSPMLAPVQWAAVAINAGLTVAMVAETRHLESPIVLALQQAERVRQAAELRGRTYALAEVVLRAYGQ